jgi:hypothetical protein|tara:strand:+ start:6691 stop:6960 length:270 start_codon:yes stop_codon:yes gene_type:complete
MTDHIAMSNPGMYAQMTLQEFWDMLNRHDWYYQFSDDHRIWSEGSKNSDQIRLLSDISPEHKKLYEGFCKHFFGGEHFNKVESPKPERP